MIRTIDTGGTDRITVDDHQAATGSETAVEPPEDEVWTDHFWQNLAVVLACYVALAVVTGLIALVR